DDRINARGINNVTFGMTNPAIRALTAEELGAQGMMGASLFKNTYLTLSGPGGAGFRILGNWKSDGAAAETFTGSGSMTLETALGNIPFVVSSSAPLTIRTSADSWAKAGVVTDITLSGLPDLSVNGT